LTISLTMPPLGVFVSFCFGTEKYGIELRKIFS
jgi:uncharacterized membrane protein YqaE (UPF0057 family)